MNCLVRLKETIDSNIFSTLFKLKDKTIFYKPSEKFLNVIIKDSLKKFFEKNFKDYLIKNLVVIKQTRLVSNRFKFFFQNNKLFEIKNIIRFNLNRILFKINCLDKLY